MRRIVAVGIVGLALLASGSISRLDASSAPIRLPAAEPRDPLLGIIWKRRGGELVRVNPSSLRPLPGRRVTMKSWPAWSFSPNRSRLVFWDERVVGLSLSPWLRVVSTRTLRTLAWLPLQSKYVAHLSWLAPDRVLSVEPGDDSVDVVVTSVSARRVLGRRTVPGWVVASARARNALVLLVSTPREIAPVRIVVADTAGVVRSMSLDRINAGVRYPPEPDVSDRSDATRFIGQRRWPALAVDPTGGRAYVVDPGGVVAEVVVDDLVVRYHDLAESRSRLERLVDWLEPDAHAKGGLNGPVRYAGWLGDGLIAVTGEDESSFVDSNGVLQVRSRAAGLSLIDTRSWSVRMLDERANRFLVGTDVLLATGWSSDPGSGRQVGMGLAAYALDGTKRFQAFDGSSAWVAHVHGRRAYVQVRTGAPMRIVDLSSGKVIGGVSHRVPSLLVEY